VFAQAFLNGGTYGDRRILSPASVHEMTRNQLAANCGTGVTRTWEASSWGIGWDVKGGKARHNSGSLTSPRTFGHTGSSGSMLWVDPERALICIMIGTRLAESGWVQPRRAVFSNAVMASICD